MKGTTLQTGTPSTPAKRIPRAPVAFRRTALEYGRPDAEHCLTASIRSVPEASMTPLIAVHAGFALAALVLGPFALWTRLGARQRPRWHRRAGYAWIACMIIAAASAVFIHGSDDLPRLAGFSPLHLLVPFTLLMLWLAFAFLRRGQIRGHRLTMLGLYFGACVTAGAFALLPDRLLGGLVWSTWLGWA